jgi:virginiamycin B lyase
LTESDGYVDELTPAGSFVTSFLLKAFAVNHPAPLDGLVQGSDGNLWIDDAYDDTIFKVTATGSISQYGGGGFACGPNGLGPSVIVDGPDGNLWLPIYTCGIGSLTTAGVATAHNVLGGGSATAVASGPDGNIWFGETSGTSGSLPISIGSVSTSGVLQHVYSTGATTNTSGDVGGITAGADGRLWFTTSTGVGAITTAGAVSLYSPAALPFGTEGITANPDGNVYATFENNSTAPNGGIARISPSGKVTVFTAGMPTNCLPVNLTTGPDGNIWFICDYPQTDNILGRLVVH